MTTSHPKGSALRVLGLLVGDISRPGSGAAVKYGQLFNELGRRCSLTGVVDVDLRGSSRYWSALLSVRGSRQRWREAFYKNLWAFRQRSALARRAVDSHAGAVGVVLQHGALFQAHTPGGPPVVVYTDFTYRLAQREDAWRNPFASVRASEEWNRYEQGVYRGAALVLTRSEHARQSLIVDYGVDPGRVLTVGGGINFHPLPPAAPLAPAPRVLFIGKDFERKGGDLLLRAFAHARERIPEAELWLVTGDPVAAGPGVRRIDPTYDRAQISALYRASSVFAMPSRCETWGDVFLEAMAHGLPCIASAADAMPEIISHSETGLLVPVGDEVALADALITLLGDAELRQRMGANGRERVALTFTWGHVAERIVAALGQARSSPAYAKA
jgi:glycosyltransferase involved in cell wall biosynthesis